MEEKMQPQIFTNEFLCTLCQDIISYTISEFIQAAISLEVVLPNLKLEGIYRYQVCKACCSKLFAAYIFKTTCMDTENRILSHVSTDKASVTELKEIYLKMNKNGNVGENQQICRLCLHLVTYGFLSLNEVDNDIVNVYIPQIDMHVTKDPVICGSCFDSLCTHGGFVKYCLEAQGKYKSADKQLCIKNEEIESKLEDCPITQETCSNIDNQYFIKNEEVEIKPEDGVLDSEFTSQNLQEDTTENENKHISEDIGETKHECMFKSGSKFEGGLKDEIVPNLKYSSEIQMYRCDVCDYETKRKPQLKVHQLIHKNPSEIEMYKCDTCTYQTKYRRNLKHHQLKHRMPSEIKMYKCNSCTYETKYRSNLKDHKLRHGTPSEIQMYKCNFCTYETKYRSNLKSHQLIHIHYMCDVCGYEAKHKSELKSHQLVHKDRSKIQMYRCDSCDYETELKNNLKMHQLMHKDLSEIQMNSCGICDHEAKSNIQQLTHDPLEIQMYKCDFCTYETECKKSFEYHQLIHKDPSAIQMCICNACYKTKFKNKLKSYQLLHKGSSEIHMYKCDTCSYETKYKCCLKTHLLKHQDSSEIQIDRCTDDVKCHQLALKEPSENEMYRCNELKCHELLHEDPSKIQIDENDTYETRNINWLKNQQ